MSMEQDICRLDAWLQKNDPELYGSLLPGLSSEEIEALEAQLEVSLPEDFKRLYQWRNGQYFDYWKARSWFPGSGACIWMNAEEIVMTWRSFNKITENKNAREIEHIKETLGDTENWWNRKWVPFLNNFGSDYHCVDTVGSFGGHIGQIVEYVHDDFYRLVVFPDISSWLGTIVAFLDASADEDPDVLPELFDELHRSHNPGYPMTFDRYKGILALKPFPTE